MTEHPASHDHFTPGEPYPDPARASGPTRWAASPAADYVANGGSSWADAMEPVVVMPAIEPPALRVGSLTGQGPASDPAA